MSFERILAIVAFPDELLAYDRWLREQPPPKHRDYLFSEQRCRFEPRKDDIVVAGEAKLDNIKGVSQKQCAAIIAAMDGERCLLEVRLEAGVAQDVFARFLRATFGRVVFAPHAVAVNEAALSGIEITRTPAAPYCIERAYWDNMIDVRRHYVAHKQALDDSSEFLALLERLHVLALMGGSLRSFYKPSSPIADRIVAPGSFYEEPVRIKGDVYFDGPRVKVPMLGGDDYQRELCRELDDDAALSDRKLIEDGVDWGRVATVRSERETKGAAWFFPPRPMTEAHWESMRRSLADGALADFHRGWVRLHPFHCANQSIAMNIVNAELGDQPDKSGIPHLILDHMALRLSREAYREVFRRAVEAFSVDAPPAERLRTVAKRYRAGAWSLLSARKD